jgi:hypothetical protein
LNVCNKDKEVILLLNRIQQIQLLGRDLRGADHENLWNQLEAEIHLHRHKTVIRACRGRGKVNKILTTPPGHVNELFLCFFLYSFFCSNRILIH